jgi:glycosyltransferase involved in cell wall biosynthesis
MQVSAALPHVTFIAKLHRKDRSSYYERAKQAVPDSRLHVVPYGAEGLPTKIFDWLQGCRALLTGASTVALEAMLMDVPVITMDFCHELADLVDPGAFAHVTTERELNEATRELVSGQPGRFRDDERARARLEDAFGPLDGQSSARIADAILSLNERARHGLPGA